MNWWRLVPGPARHNELLSIELSWTGEPTTGRDLGEIIQAKDPSIMFIVETLTDEARIDRVMHDIDFDKK